ncbi:Protein kinase superfamily protein [Euphorbia peplus]|nr:Protein kinase superfamily protein [Euphorbia peplus]
MHFLRLTVSFLLCFTISSADSITSVSCPVNFSYIETYPWRTSPCLNPYAEHCCETLLSVITIGFAQYLKQTSNFLLPDANYSFSCLLTLHAKLAAVSLHPALIPHCFQDPSQFVANPPLCAGIQTVEDWDNNVGGISTQLLESSCKGDLTNLTRCDSCVKAGFEVTSQLIRSSKNNTNAASCFYLVVLYVAGIVSDPLDTRMVPCVVGIETRDTSTSKKPSNRLIAGLIGVIVFISLVLGLSILYKKRANRKTQEKLQKETVINIKARLPPNLGSKWFDEEELQCATDGFSKKNVIGQGTYGVVYRGMLSDGTSVAVKEVLEADLVREDDEFFNEVEVVSKIRHKNLLPLRGYSVTSNGIHGPKKYLVFDFMSNGTLFNHLSSEKTRKLLTWPQRRDIILDVTKGIAYLHYGVRPAIYHRDIKATNILLDSDMKAKVSDFGLAKQSIEGQSHVTTKVAGTHGYMAPEYALYGQLSEKADVYSFGILVLETMSGRSVLDPLNSPFLLISEWAWMQMKSGKMEDVFDETLTEEGAEGTMERFVSVGMLCAHVNAESRPTIVEALSMLEGNTEVPEIPDRPLPVNSESFRSSCSFPQTSGCSSISRLA